MGLDHLRNRNAVLLASAVEHDKGEFLTALGANAIRARNPTSVVQHLLGHFHIIVIGCDALVVPDTVGVKRAVDNGDSAFHQLVGDRFAVNRMVERLANIDIPKHGLGPGAVNIKVQVQEQVRVDQFDCAGGVVFEILDL